MSYEWPLLVFTFLAEAAVGTFICAGCAQLVFSRRSEEANRALFLPLLAASPVVLCIGLVASLMHLGQVVGAPSALLNIGSSWLSREILFGSLALVGFVVTVVVSRKSFGTVGVIAWGVSTAIGLVFLASAGNAYLLPTVPLWNTMATPLSMIAGAVMAGCAVVSAFVLFAERGKGFFAPYLNGGSAPASSSVCRVAFAGAASALLGCFYFLLSLGFGQACLNGPVGADSVAFAAGAQAPIMVIGFVSGFVGVSLQLIGSVVPAGRINDSVRAALTSLGCVLVLLCLFMSRMLFYSCAINLQY